MIKHSKLIYIRAVQGMIGDCHEGDGLRWGVLVRHSVVAVPTHEDLNRLVEPSVSYMTK